VERLVHLGEETRVYRIVMVNPKGDRSVGRFRCWWESNVQMNRKLQAVVVWSGFMWLRLPSLEVIAAYCEHSNRLSSCMKCREFLDRLRCYYIFKK